MSRQKAMKIKVITKAGSHLKSHDLPQMSVDPAVRSNRTRIN